ncbi:hypothetical protein CVT24_002005, partial [Panaeolus cyanescens]
SGHLNVGPKTYQYADELADDAFSDHEEDNLTEEQQGLDESAILEKVQAEIAQAQMNDGLEQVRQVIGSADFSGVSDQSIKDALWDSYFDVDHTIQWAMDEQDRRRAAKERKVEIAESCKVDREDEWVESDDQNDHGEHVYADQDYVQSRVPSIFRAQQQPDFDQEAYQWVDSTPDVPQATKNRLSTITEKSERTEPSTMWQSRRLYTSNRQSFTTENETLDQNTPRGQLASLPSSPTTSYGQELGSRDSIQDLSILAPRPVPELEPSNASTVTPNYVEGQQGMVSVGLAGSVASESNDHSANKRPVSKLSKLANSRASAISLGSQSSRSSGTALSGSVKTFPALRPSVQSMKPPSSIASPSSASSKSLPALPQTPTATPAPSETDTFVRRAIQAAMESEQVGRLDTPPASSTGKESELSNTPTPIVRPLPSDFPASPQQSRPQSKLALLAQQKKAETVRTPPPPSTHLSETVPSVASRPLSKLALLAQQKVDASRVPKLPKTTTEYLTPIANGASVTTAITTSYQSLYSITDPNTSSFLPRLDVVPIQVNAVESSSPMDVKRSKLAMKVKRADAQQPTSPGALSPGEFSIIGSPLFPSKVNRARASPSAFASVLIHDNIILYEGKGKEPGNGEASPVKKKKKKRAEKNPHILSDQEHGSRSPSKRQTKSHTATPVGQQSATFAFDVPSPDDIVLNARRGTSLGTMGQATRSTQDSGKLASRS